MKRESQRKGDREREREGEREGEREREREIHLIDIRLDDFDLFLVPIFLALKINPKKIFDIFMKKSKFKNYIFMQEVLILHICQASTRWQRLYELKASMLYSLDRRVTFVNENKYLQIKVKFVTERGANPE